MNITDGAVYLGVDEDELLSALTKRKTLMDAWTGGRKKLRSSLHGALIREAMNGKVSAIRLALQRLDSLQDDVAFALKAKDQGKDDAAVGPIRVPDFVDAFERLMNDRTAG